MPWIASSQVSSLQLLTQYLISALPNSIKCQILSSQKQAYKYYYVIWNQTKLQAQTISKQNVWRKPLKIWLRHWPAYIRHPSHRLKYHLTSVTQGLHPFTNREKTTDQNRQIIDLYCWLLSVARSLSISCAQTLWDTLTNTTFSQTSSMVSATGSPVRLS